MTTRVIIALPLRSSFENFHFKEKPVGWGSCGSGVQSMGVVLFEILFGISFAFPS